MAKKITRVGEIEIIGGAKNPKPGGQYLNGVKIVTAQFEIISVCFTRIEGSWKFSKHGNYAEAMQKLTSLQQATIRGVLQSHYDSL